MDGYPGRFINDNEPRLEVMMYYFNGSRGYGGFMSMNGMRNTISVLNIIVFIDDFAVDGDGPAGYRCAVVFWLSVPKLSGEYF
jgi:hypothetical protein